MSALADNAGADLLDPSSSALKALSIARICSPCLSKPVAACCFPALSRPFFPQLQLLDVSGWEGCGERDLENVLLHCPSVRLLFLDGWSGWSDGKARMRKGQSPILQRITRSCDGSRTRAVCNEC